MDAKGYLLSESDAAAVRELLEQFRSERQGGKYRSIRTSAQDFAASDVYIAQVPASGIPPAVEPMGTASSNLQPGFADDVTFYQLDETATPPAVIPIDSLKRRLYNLSLSEVPPLSWLLVKKDKRGSWYAETGGGGCAPCFFLCGDIRLLPGYDPTQDQVLFHKKATGTGTELGCLEWRDVHICTATPGTGSDLI